MGGTFFSDPSLIVSRPRTRVPMEAHMLCVNILKLLNKICRMLLLYKHIFRSTGKVRVKTSIWMSGLDHSVRRVSLAS